MDSFLHSRIGFLDVHDSYYTATVDVHYIFFPSFLFNLILEKIVFYHLMLKAADFSWFLSFLALIFLGFFCLLVSYVIKLLLLLLFLFLYYSYNRNNNHN
jgi:hypothetical protein